MAGARVSRRRVRSGRRRPHRKLRRLSPRRSERKKAREVPGRGVGVAWRGDGRMTGASRTPVFGAVMSWPGDLTPFQPPAGLGVAKPYGGAPGRSSWRHASSPFQRRLEPSCPRLEAGTVWGRFGRGRIRWSISTFVIPEPRSGIRDLMRRRTVPGSRRCAPSGLAGITGFIVSSARPYRLALNNSRPMSMRRTSLVPAPIS